MLRRLYTSVCCTTGSFHIIMLKAMDTNMNGCSQRYCQILTTKIRPVFFWYEGTIHQTGWLKKGHRHHRTTANRAKNLWRKVLLTPWRQNPEVHHCIHKSPPMITILSQVNPLYTPPTNLPKVHFEPINARKNLYGTPCAKTPSH
jgi:hypothetical protein